MDDTNGQKICSICEEPLIEEDDIYFGDFKTHYEGKPLCERCYFEDEPIVTVIYGDDESEPKYISATRNYTEGEFWADWHSTDPWRGHYDVFSQNYVTIFSDAILSFHESEMMLKNLNDKVVEKFLEENLDFCRSFSRTSNVFSTGYDIWILNNPLQLLKSYKILSDVKKEVDFDNPLYSTGIIMGRDELKKFQEILGGDYQINNDNDVLTLLKNDGENIIEKVQDKLNKEEKSGKEKV